jgi:hypothetical protein
MRTTGETGVVHEELAADRIEIVEEIQKGLARHR